MLWEHELQASVSTAFSSSPKLAQVFLFLDRNTEYMFSISFRKHRDKKRKQLVHFDYQNVKLILFAHAITMPTVHATMQFCVQIKLYKHDF